MATGFIPPHGGYEQLRRLENDFVETGGLREAMTRARLAKRRSE